MGLKSSLIGLGTAAMALFAANAQSQDLKIGELEPTGFKNAHMVQETRNGQTTFRIVDLDGSNSADISIVDKNKNGIAEWSEAVWAHVRSENETILADGTSAKAVTNYDSGDIEIMGGVKTQAEKVTILYDENGHEITPSTPNVPMTKQAVINKAMKVLKGQN